ncbi:hypothetical protein CIHG_01608 [Coccidioides immitis H538.4]|uniref:Uncharacterized protein n=1 Tax=Coccidioides immitis H538.4 TaxID=396776 RepID=A0A0J8RIM0_COCIT|nr:hypothetical protein CIHG_01608 [Coccidioides immitis H538.4]
MARKRLKSSARLPSVLSRPKGKKLSNTRYQRQYRLALGGNTKSQKTLTQIDFVNRQSNFEPSEDLDLEYIEEDENEEADFTPNLKKHSRGQKKPPGNKRTRFIEPADTTLTQMGYGTLRDEIDDDDIRPRSPAKKAVCTPMRTQEGSAFSLQAIKEESDDLEVSDVEQAYGRSHKKRKLSCARENAFAKGSGDPDETNFGGAVSGAGGNIYEPPNRIPRGFMSPSKRTSQASNRSSTTLSGSLVTPQKRRWRVVPSSQSPESPEVVFSSVKRTNAVIQSPLKSRSANNTPSRTGENHTRDSLSAKRKALSHDFIHGDFSLPPPIGTVRESPTPRSPNQMISATGDLYASSSPLSSIRSPDMPSKSFLDSIQPRRTTPRPASTGSIRSRRTCQQIVYGTDDDESDAEIRFDTFPERIAIESIEPSLKSILDQSQHISTPNNPRPMDNISIKPVPASSQAHANHMKVHNTQHPPPHTPTVFVESSQNALNVPESNDVGWRSSSRGVLTASQLVPNNLMDSIPTPPDWASSPAAEHEVTKRP